MSMAGSAPSIPPLSLRENDESALVGSNFATSWGSVGFFGPLTTRPDFWDGGIGQRLVSAACDQFDAWGVRHAGLFTFAHSAKHVGLYAKFGFCPRFLTAIMAAPTGASTVTSAFSCYSALPAGQQQEAENACRELTEELYPGLDLRGEIRTVAARGLGDTALLGVKTAGSRALPSAIGVQRAKPAKAAASPNSPRCGRDRTPGSASARCSTPALRSRARPTCRIFWPG
jgi:hypothetical protein